MPQLSPIVIFSMPQLFPIVICSTPCSHSYLLYILFLTVPYCYLFYAPTVPYYLFYTPTVPYSYSMSQLFSILYPNCSLQLFYVPTVFYSISQLFSILYPNCSLQLLFQVPTVCSLQLLFQVPTVCFLQLLFQVPTVLYCYLLYLPVVPHSYLFYIPTVPHSYLFYSQLFPTAINSVSKLFHWLSFYVQVWHIKILSYGHKSSVQVLRHQSDHSHTYTHVHSMHKTEWKVDGSRQNEKTSIVIHSTCSDYPSLPVQPPAPIFFSFTGQSLPSWAMLCCEVGGWQSNPCAASCTNSSLPHHMPWLRGQGREIRPWDTAVPSCCPAAFLSQWQGNLATCSTPTLPSVSATKHAVSSLVCQPQNTLSHLLSVGHKMCCLISCLLATNHSVSSLVCQPQNMLFHLLSVSHKTCHLISCLSATKHALILSLSHKTYCLTCQSLNMLSHLSVSH